MANTITRIYRNTSKETYNIPGVGIIEAGGQLSITSEYPAPVNLQNYPGLVDVLAEEEAAAANNKSNLGKSE